MKRDGHDTAAFFVGTEVEHTPAFGLKTLFVVGIQDVEKIQKKLKSLYDIEHIFFGANQSFNPNSGGDWADWERMIMPFLKTSGKLCTLDLDVKHVFDLHESGFCENNNFIPMISVKVPYIGQLNYNAVLKIDDIDFDKSNPGVWCHQVHDLKNRRTFTDWSKYTKDKVIK